MNGLGRMIGYSGTSKRTVEIAIFKSPAQRSQIKGPHGGITEIGSKIGVFHSFVTVRIHFMTGAAASKVMISRTRLS